MTTEQTIGLIMIIAGIIIGVICWFTKEPENLGKTLEDKNHLWKKDSEQ